MIVHTDIYDKMVERMAFKVGSSVEIRQIMWPLSCMQSINISH